MFNCVCKQDKLLNILMALLVYVYKHECINDSKNSGENAMCNNTVRQNVLMNFINYSKIYIYAEDETNCCILFRLKMIF